jgi:Mrp family chromosome partitioning ATPase
MPPRERAVPSRPRDTSHPAQTAGRPRAETPPAAAPKTPTAPDSGPATGAKASTAIRYTRTKVFTAPQGHLERNRIMNPDAADPASAAYRMLRTQVLQRLDAHGWRSLGVFSPGADDGKTTTAVNLAVSLASDQLHTVLLVDFDFRRPSIAACLGLMPQFGAEDALTGVAPLEDCLYHPEGFDRLVVLPARGVLEHSSEILAGPISRALVAELRARYPERIIIVDLPPVLLADDALAFAPLIECGLVVVAEGRTQREDLVRTIELLHKTPLVGTVLNRAADAPTGY